jgi:hypothetical protein
MTVVYPLFALLDDRSMLIIEHCDRILYHLEAIDIENDEYFFWDAAGTPTEAWERIQRELRKRHKQPPWVTRLFTR